MDKDNNRLQVTAAVITDGDRVLIARRGENSRHPNRWEFPGGKQEAGESLRECLVREIKEELDLDIEVLDKLVEIDHDYEDLSLTLHAFICRAKSEAANVEGPEGRAWLHPLELKNYDLLPPDRKIAGILINRI